MGLPISPPRKKARQLSLLELPKFGARKLPTGQPATPLPATRPSPALAALIAEREKAAAEQQAAQQPQKGKRAAKGAINPLIDFEEALGGAEPCKPRGMRRGSYMQWTSLHKKLALAAYVHGCSTAAQR